MQNTYLLSALNSKSYLQLKQPLPRIFRYFELWFWMVHFCEWQESKKPWIPVCPFVKQLSHFACRGHFLLVLVNDLLRRWLAQTLAHWASEFWKLLDQQENLLVPDYQTEHLSSRADGVILSINQSINQATLFKRVTLMSRKKAGYKKCTCKMAIICDRPFPNHL